MSFNQIANRLYKFAVISTTMPEFAIQAGTEEKSITPNEKITQSCLLRIDSHNKPVISTTGRNLLIETYFSSLCLVIRNVGINKLPKVFVSIFFFLLISVYVHSQNVQRVISLAPSVTENIYLLGAQNRLVGCTSFCTEAVNDGKEQVGNAVDVNIEKILMLKPDLVLAMMLTKSQDIETMKRLGIKVQMIPTPKNFEEICDQMEQIAKPIGYENVAREIVQKSKHTVDSLKHVSGQPSDKLKIFFQLGSNPIFTVLENTFMNDYILFCNGENIANGLTKGSVTRESVLMKNPDVIFVATMGGFGADEKKVWENYSGLKAAKNNKIFLIDSETSCSPTPVNFVKAFTDVVTFINH